MPNNDVVPFRQLLHIDLDDSCRGVLARLSAEGVVLFSATLDQLDPAYSGVVLILLRDASAAALQRLVGCVRRSSACWVALLDARSTRPEVLAAFAQQWLFAALPWPGDIERLQESLTLAQGAVRLCPPPQRGRGRYLGNSSSARALRKAVVQCAEPGGPVLISGEWGTGRLLLARLLHRHSSRAKQRFVCFDCAVQAGTEGTTGLWGDKNENQGLLAMAVSGTLVLEHLAELPMEAQQRLLDHLQQSPGLNLLTIDDGELEGAVRDGRVLEELYWRLAGQQLKTVPLRERQADQMLLAEYFASAEGLFRGRAEFSDEAVIAIHQHLWPGNVRELRNRVLRARLQAQGRAIQSHDLGLSAQGSQPQLATLQQYILAAERQALTDALARWPGNMSQAARSLGVSRPTFYRLLHKHRFR